MKGLNLNYEPEIVVDISGLTREEWLDYRKKGIGGSDVAAIMGISPFATIRDLYNNKVGILPAIPKEEESNWVAKEVGHRLEDLVAEIFVRKTGLKVFPVRKMFRHPLYPFMLADVDFFILFPDGTYGILECKTCNYNASSNRDQEIDIVKVFVICQTSLQKVSRADRRIQIIKVCVCIGCILDL